MGKHEKGTPKELANRSKSKGLQKLKFFCQMCNKQCRDANGYKCHLTSESHQRQLLLVAENTDAYVNQFSREFETSFIQLLRGTYGSKRVRANEVYQDYIRDKGHVHMNATRWHTLSGFVQYLESSGKCKIDKVDEKGWFIQFIDKEMELRREEEQRKAKAEKDDEERQQEMILARVQRALDEQGSNVDEYKPTDLMRADENEKISLNLFQPMKPTLEELNKPSTSLGVSVFDKLSNKVKKEEPEDDDEYDRKPERRESRRHSQSRSRSRSRSRDDRHRRRSRSRSRDRVRDNRNDRDRKKQEKSKKSALEEIKEMNERKKEKQNRKDHWLHKGIVVKVMTKKLGADYYKSKGIVKALIDDYHAKVELDDGTLVKLNQDHVETVIPQVGREMLIVNGAYRGCLATLDSLDEKKFAVNLTISAGLLKGREVQVPYEDASKFAV